MLTHRHLKYFILGVSWYLIQAKEDQITQPNITVCSQDTVFLCTLQRNESFSCINMSSCKERHQEPGKRQHGNKSLEENVRQLMDAQCDLSFSNCTFIGNGNHTCLLCRAVENHQNHTDIFKVSGCPEPSTGFMEESQTPQISEMIIYFIIPISMLAMYLSYRCSQRIFSDTSIHIYPDLQPQKHESLVNVNELQPEKIDFI
ncbi:uncharacterized protein O3C94_007075 [Discoglossus pictus]